MSDYLAPHFESSALVLIDVQNDFIDGAMPVTGTREVLPALAHLLTAYRRAGRPIVHAIRLYVPGSSDVDPGRRAQIEAGAKIVAPGTPGSQIPSTLQPGPATLDAAALLAG